MSSSSGFRRGPLDRIFLTLGVWGRWQVTQIGLVLSLQSVAVYQLLSIVFLGYEPPFRCRDSRNISTGLTEHMNYTSTCDIPQPDVNGTVNYGQCGQGFEYDNPRESSIVSEWNLVCDKEYLTGLTQTVLIGGQAFGATFFSYLSDKFGRRKVFLLVQWAMLAVSLTTVFSPDVIVFTILRFFTGALQQGLIMLGTVLPLEITTMEHRAVILLLTGVIWGLFNGSLTAFGYAFRNLSWRYLQLAFSGVSVVFLVPNMLFLDESLRWLVASRRGRDAQKLLKKAARINGVRLSADDDLTMALSMCVESPSVVVNSNCAEAEKEIPTESENPDETAMTKMQNISKNSHGKYSLIDILKNGRLRMILLIMFFIWIVSSLGYFGLSLTTSALAGDRFLNFFLMAVADTPAAICAYLTMKLLGRRPTCAIFNGLSAACMLTTVFLTEFSKGPSTATAITALSIIGKFGISASFGSLFIYTSEMFPTTVRSLGCGLASSASRIGGMIAPFVGLLASQYPWLFGTVFGAGCLFVCALVMFLPETGDKELPQTIEDVEKWYTDKKPIHTREPDNATVNLLSDYD